MRKCALILALCWTLAGTTQAADLLKMATEGHNYFEFKHEIDALPKGELNKIRDEHGRTLLHCAVGGRHQEGVMILLRAGADVNLQDDTGRTPLFEAMPPHDAADVLIMDLLTFSHADVNVVDHAGWTPLALAVQAGDTTDVKTLLRLGAEAAPSRVAWNQTPKFLALEAHDPKMTSLLASAGTGKQADPAAAANFDAAVLAGDLPALEAALDAGAPIDQQNEQGATALFRAVHDHRAALVSRLLFQGANSNLATRDGKTPLSESTRWQDVPGQRITLLLLLSGADVNAALPKDGSPLSRAVWGRNNFATQWLIWSGAKLDVREAGLSLMQVAKRPEANWQPIIFVLARNGVPDESPVIKVRPEVLALFTAVQKDDAATVERLFNEGLPLLARDSEDRDAFSLALFQGNFDIIDVFLRHGMNVNYQPSKDGFSPLHWMAAWGNGNGDADVAGRYVDELLKRGANPNLAGTDGTTPLMVSAKQGVVGGNTLALLKVAGVNLRDKKGMTALGIARQYHRTALIKLLEEHGAQD